MTEEIKKLAEEKGIDGKVIINVRGSKINGVEVEPKGSMTYQVVLNTITYARGFLLNRKFE